MVSGLQLCWQSRVCEILLHLRLTDSPTLLAYWHAVTQIHSVPTATMPVSMVCDISLASAFALLRHVLSAERKAGVHNYHAVHV